MSVLRPEAITRKLSRETLGQFGSRNKPARQKVRIRGSIKSHMVIAKNSAPVLNTALYNVVGPDRDTAAIKICMA